jgi:DNA-binding NarL/FixJ family response regulator
MERVTRLLRMSESLPHSAPKHRILIVDTQPLFRDGVRHCIERQKDLACCGEADSTASAQKAVDSLKPDLVIVDLRLKTEDGLELIRSLRAEHPALHILVLAQNDEMVFGDRALRAGAQGYLMKDQAAGELIAAIRAVLGGEIYLSQRLAGLMLKKLWRGDAGGDVAAILSARELQVFQMLGSGIGTRQVAHNLNLSIKTVETHREHIKTKLGLKDAAGLVHAATMWTQENVPADGRNS